MTEEMAPNVVEVDENKPGEPQEGGNPGCLGFVIGLGALFLGSSFLICTPLTGLLLLDERPDDVSLSEYLLFMTLGGLPGLFIGVAMASYGWTLLRRSSAKEGEKIDVFSGFVGRVNAICGLIFAGGGILLLVGLTLFSFIEESVGMFEGFGYALFFIPLLYWVGTICWAGLRRNIGAKDGQDLEAPELVMNSPAYEHKEIPQELDGETDKDDIRW